MRCEGLVTVAAVSALATGCSATVVDDGDPTEPAETSAQGSVTVERTVARTGGDEPPSVRAHVSARFMRLGGGLDAELAERVVGSPLVLPPEGSCRWHEPLATGLLPESARQGSIELLDVGDIVVRAGPSTLPLAPRAFPDVGDMVSGVVYTSRERSADLPVGASYLIETTGSARIEEFRLKVEAPQAPAEVRIAEQDLEDDELQAVADEPLALGWQAGDRAAGDRIYVDITPLGPSATRPLRCALADTGSAEIPAEYLEGQSAVAEVAIHRFRQTVVSLSAIDEAVVEFDFAVSVPVALLDAP